jgi:hypothetical protein
MKITPSLVAIMVFVASRSVSVGVASASQLPRQVLPQTGRVAVTGHFEDRDGHQLCRLVDVFPAPVRDFVSLTRELWATQIRVFEKDGQMLLNELRVDQDGQFTIDLPRPGVYRFELNPTESFRFVDPVVTVSAATTHIALALEAKPYCLYGTILDATDGTPVTETLNVSAVGANYTTTRGGARYALFFDVPRSIEFRVDNQVLLMRIVPRHCTSRSSSECNDKTFSCSDWPEQRKPSSFMSRSKALNSPGGSGCP